jgi:hypothetical protein
MTEIVLYDRHYHYFCAFWYKKLSEKTIEHRHAINIGLRQGPRGGGQGIDIRCMGEKEG